MKLTLHTKPIGATDQGPSALRRSVRQRHDEYVRSAGLVAEVSIPGKNVHLVSGVESNIVVGVSRIDDGACFVSNGVFMRSIALEWYSK